MNWDPRVVDISDPTRWAAVVGALRGRWPEPDELGYDLAYHHLALVADRSLALDALARMAERELLRVPVPGGGVWGWLGGEQEISDTDLDALVVWQRAQAGRVGFGEPRRGIVGFAESHRQAREAAAIAQALGEPVVRFADVMLPVALLREPFLAHSFVERELGVVARPDQRMQELRVTLCAYLEHGQSVSAAAASLRCARKTIQRRLHAAERLLRRHVDDRSGELLVALRMTDLLRTVDQMSFSEGDADPAMLSGAEADQCPPIGPPEGSDATTWGDPLSHFGPRQVPHWP